MGLKAYIERALSLLLYRIRGHDAKLFTRSRVFARFPNPTIQIDAPGCGASNSKLPLDYTQMGRNLFPTLRWSIPTSIDAKEYIVVCEDADAPIPVPISHGFFYSIPAQKTEVTTTDVQMVNPEAKANSKVKGGFNWIPTIRGPPYVGPRPLLSHGPHRYFYQVVALKEPLDLQTLGPKPTKKKIAQAIEGKVAGWGDWVGVAERSWAEHGSK